MKKFLISVMMLFGVTTASALELKLTSHCDSIHTTIIQSYFENVEYHLTWNTSSNSLYIYPYINGTKKEVLPDNNIVNEEYNTLLRVFERNNEDGFWDDLFFRKENEKYLKEFLEKITEKYFKYLY